MAPDRCVRPGSGPPPGRRSASSAATTRCSRRWRSTPSPGPCCTASRRSRATSPGCARSTSRGPRLLGAVLPEIPMVPVSAARHDRRRRRPDRRCPVTRGACRRPRPGLHLHPVRSVRSARGWAGSRITTDPSCWSWTTWPTATTCSGRRSASATSPSSGALDGGIEAWRAAGHPVEASGLSRADRSGHEAARGTGGPAPGHRCPPAGRIRRRATSRTPFISAREPWPIGSTRCPVTDRSP